MRFVRRADGERGGRGGSVEVQRDGEWVGGDDRQEQKRCEGEHDEDRLVELNWSRRNVWADGRILRRSV